MTARKRTLSAYKKKRNLRRTPEPGGGKRKFSWAKKGPIFVIQKHDASSLHYDFRIEVDGVLVSWAVPKGPSTNPKEKRLAMLTEDHPLEYADFEGVIPEGQYGAGTVMVWDRGTYENRKEEDDDKKAQSIAEQLDDGHATITLKGRKLKGGYALIRTGNKKDKRWLLIKMDDKDADARRKPTSSQPKSVKSGRTMHQIRKQAEDDDG